MPIAAPAWMKPPARRVWDEQVPDLISDGVLDPRLLSVLADYCVLQAEFRRAPRKMVTSRLALMLRCSDKLRLGLTVTRKGAKAVEDPAEKYFTN
jgi:phage terminase small subunit